MTVEGLALALRRPHHAPSLHGCLLDASEHDALERKPDAPNHHQRGQHQVGVEELLGIEDHPAEPPVRGGEEFGADYRDP